MLLKNVFKLQKLCYNPNLENLEEKTNNFICPKKLLFLPKNGKKKGGGEELETFSIRKKHAKTEGYGGFCLNHSSTTV